MSLAEPRPLAVSPVDAASDHLRDHPGADRVPAAAWLFIAALVLGIFSGHWWLLGIPVPLDRVALAGSFALLGMAWLRGTTPATRVAPVHVAMALAVALCVASAAWAGTLVDRQSLFALLDRVMLPYVGFVVAPLVLSTPLARRRLVQALTVTGLYVSLTAVISVWGPEALLWPRYLADPAVGIAHSRARGPSAEAVGTGLLVITCGAAAALNAVRTTGLQRVVSALTVGICIVAGFLSLTRSIWGGMILVVLAISLVVPQARRRILGLLGGAVVLVGLVIVLVPGVGTSALDRFSTERSLEDRAYTNEAAIRMMVDRPLTGVGWGQFVHESPAYLVQHDTAPLTNVGIEVHNVFLSRGAEMGMPGLLLALVVVLLGPLRGLLPRRRSLLSSASDVLDMRVLATAAVVSWLAASLVTGLSFSFANLLTWVLSGLAFGGGVVAARGAPVEVTTL